MYNSPIEKIFGEIQNEIKRKDEEHLMMAVNQSVGYAVDKTELLKALQYDRRQYEKGYTDAIVEYGNKWIPVSERLPEDFQRVLVTIVNYNGDKVVRVAEYSRRTFKIKENYEHWQVGEKGLLAWRPLPEPYKVEKKSEVCKTCYYNDGEVHAECVVCDKVESEEK